jgi:hypothetical protein
MQLTAMLATWEVSNGSMIFRSADRGRTAEVLPIADELGQRENR